MKTQSNTLNKAAETIYPLIIESRFGDIIVNESDTCDFPEGIYGFDDYKSYAIANFPGQTLTKFQILQCLDEIGLVFLLTPLHHQGQLLIPQSDLMEATDLLKLDFDNCDFYAITTVCEKDGALEFSLNLKAPLVVEKNQKKAWQYILERTEYPIRYVIKSDL